MQTNFNTAYDPIATTYDTDSVINGLNQITSQTGTSAFSYDIKGNLTNWDGHMRFVRRCVAIIITLPNVFQ